MYLYVAIIITLFSCVEMIIKSKKSAVIFLFLPLILWLIFFVGLRDGSVVGIDSPAYYEFYKEIYPSVEFGYKWLNALFSSNELPYNIFLLFLNFIAIGLFSYFLKKSSPLIIFPLLIFYSDFYFYYNFSGIRQGVAMSFIALSFYYFFIGKNRFAITLVLLGSLFHVSALVGLLAYVIPKTKIKLIDYLKLIITLSFGTILVGYLIENIPYLSYKFMYYAEMQEQEDNIITSFYIGLVKRFLVIGAVILIFRKFFSENENIYYFNLFMVGFIIYMTLYLISPDFGVRFGSYFLILDGMIISRYIVICNSFTNKVVLFILFTMVAFYKVYTYTLIPAYEYKWIFS